MHFVTVHYLGSNGWTTRQEQYQPAMPEYGDRVEQGSRQGTVRARFYQDSAFKLLVLWDGGCGTEVVFCDEVEKL